MFTSSWYHRALFGLSLAAFAPPALLSQSLDSTVPVGQSPLQTQVNMIKLSSRLRLQTATHKHDGRLIFRTADSLGVRGEGPDETRLSLTEVDSMWVRQPRTFLGLVIGTLVGAGAYIVTTSAIDEDSDQEGLDDLFGGALWIGSALAGTVIGSLTSHWVRVHPR